MTVASISELIQLLKQFIESFQDFHDYSDDDGNKKLEHFLELLEVRVSLSV